MIYKPTDLNPSSQTFDVTETPIFLECKVDTSNVAADGFTIKILDSENNVVFSSIPEGKTLNINYITIISELKEYMKHRVSFANYIKADSTLNTGYNGTYLKIPFSVADSDKVVSGNTEYKTVAINQMFYSPQENETGSGLYRYKVDDDGVVKFNETVPVEMYNGQEYKWSITLYQLQKDGDKFILPDNPVYYDMPLTTGTALGSNDIRIQSVFSNEIYADYFIQPINIPGLKYDPNNPIVWTQSTGDDDQITQIGARVLVQSYDQSFGYVYPITGENGFTSGTIKPGDGNANAFRIFKRGNNIEDLTAYQQVLYVCSDPLDEVVVEEWSKDKEYETWDIVIYNNVLYITIQSQSVNGNTPGDSNTNGWLTYDEYMQITQWNSAVTYKVGDIVSSERFSVGTLCYRCIKDISSSDSNPNPQDDSEHWSEPIGFYNSSKAKLYDNVCWRWVTQAVNAGEEYGELTYYTDRDPKTGYVIQNIDGIILSGNERIVLNKQKTSEVVRDEYLGSPYNGIYFPQFYSETLKAPTSTDPSALYKVTVRWVRTPDADTWGEIMNKIVAVTSAASKFFGENIQISDVNESSDAYGTINQTPFKFVLEKPIVIYKTYFPEYESEKEYKKDDLVSYFKKPKQYETYQSDKSYSPGSVVLYQNVLYACIKQTVVDSESSIDYGPSNKNYWAKYTAMSYYKCNADDPQNAPWDLNSGENNASEWILLSDDVGNVGLIFYNNPLGTADPIKDSDATDSTEGRLYIRHFEGVQPGMTLFKNTTNNHLQYIKIKDYNSTYNFVTYDAWYDFDSYKGYSKDSNPVEYEDNDIGWTPADIYGNGTKYQIKTFFRESDENAFYFYTIPHVVIYFDDVNGKNYVEKLSPSEYDDSQTYAKGDIVYVNGTPTTYYQATQEVPSGNDPPNITYWNNYSKGAIYKGGYINSNEYNNQQTYLKNDIVYIGNSGTFTYYQAIQDVPKEKVPGSSEGTDYWDLYNYPNYVKNTGGTFDVVFDPITGLYFQAYGASSSGDYSYNDPGCFPGRTKSAEPYISNKSYKNGDIVIYQNEYRICLQSSQPITNFAVYPWQLYTPEITQRTVIVDADYTQKEYIQWKTAQWFLYDEKTGTLLDKSGILYDGKLSYTFNGLNGKSNSTDPNISYIVKLVLETYTGYRLIVERLFETTFVVQEIEKEGLIEVTFDCDTMAVKTVVTKEAGYIKPNLVDDDYVEYLPSEEDAAKYMSLSTEMSYNSVVFDLESSVAAVPLTSNASAFRLQGEYTINSEKFAGNVIGISSSPEAEDQQDVVSGDFHVQLDEVYQKKEYQDEVLQKKSLLYTSENRNQLIGSYIDENGQTALIGIQTVVSGSEVGSNFSNYVNNYKDYEVISDYQPKLSSDIYSGCVENTFYSDKVDYEVTRNETTDSPVRNGYLVYKNNDYINVYSTVEVDQHNKSKAYIKDSVVWVFDFLLTRSFYKAKSAVPVDIQISNTTYWQKISTNIGFVKRIQNPLLRKEQFRKGQVDFIQSYQEDYFDSIKFKNNNSSYKIKNDGDNVFYLTRGLTTAYWNDYECAVPGAGALVGRSADHDIYLYKNVQTENGWKFRDTTDEKIKGAFKDTDAYYWSDGDSDVAVSNYEVISGTVTLNGNRVAQSRALIETGSIDGPRYFSLMTGVTGNSIGGAEVNRQYLEGSTFTFDIDLTMDELSGVIEPNQNGKLIAYYKKAENGGGGA